MGLAASQARLLSITSRMADNELRSQTINNAKMRLATESSQVSEEYIEALNKTQLMMKSYDSAGDQIYQDLTFNTLTMYSPLNNQYGLVNKAGELLVSEIDTANFQDAFNKAKADPDVDKTNNEAISAKALEEFLKSYHLEKDTTYFDQESVIAAYGDKMKDIYEGDMEFEFIEATGTNPPEAKRISGIHYGYEKSQTSVEYGVYEKLLKDYQTADKEYTETLKKSMKEAVFGSEGTLNGTKTTYEDAYKKFVAEGSDEANNDPAVRAGKYTQYQSFMKQIWNSSIKDYISTQEGGPIFTAQMEEFLSIAVGQAYTEEVTPAPNRGSLADYTAAGATVVLDPLDPTKGTITWPTDVDPEEKLPEQGGDADPYGTGGVTWTEVTSYTLDEETYCDLIEAMFTYFQSNFMSVLDRDKFAKTNPTDEVKAAKEKYNAASEALSKFIFGTVIPEDEYGYLDDMEWIINGPLNDPTDATSGRQGAKYATTALDTSEGGIAGAYVDVEDIINGEEVPNSYYCNFQAIADVYLIDQMMDLYGTPKYTWIDTENPNENAEAKAKWYTRLFERMNEGSYQTLEHGLANSKDWIQYALESSLVSMVQVNDDGQWVSTMYTNCSDITESTADVDITVAEAEYTKKMNAIQAKDKRYDIELKNIDTEHTSLQTEYDSIKTVMDKNVERNFKMFEA